jgi:trans-aconitate methyltransferase
LGRELAEFLMAQRDGKVLLPYKRLFFIATPR